MPAAEPTLLEEDFFADRTFTDLALEGADLSGKELQRCTFRRCKLPASRWAKSKLEDCTFDGCDLLRIAPRELALRGVTFRTRASRASTGRDLAPLPDVRFDKCDLRYCSFVKLRLRGTKITGCLAREANFIDVDLTEVDFSGTDLRDSTWQGCTLAKTNFARAIGVLFDPQKNRVKGARLGIEGALALVMSLGIVVEGLDPPA